MNELILAGPLEGIRMLLLNFYVIPPSASMAGFVKSSGQLLNARESLQT